MKKLIDWICNFFNEESIYTKEYFIEKFSALENHEIGSGNLKNHCALWHCGVRDYNMTDEASALCKLFTPLTGSEFYYSVFSINDNTGVVEGDTPKERLLNALNLI